MYKRLNERIDSLWVNLKGQLPDDLDSQLHECQKVAKAFEQDAPTKWTYNNQVVYLKPHGAGKGWRYILYTPEVHFEVGTGKLNKNVAKVRFSSLLLHADDIYTILLTMLDFFTAFLGYEPGLQVSEVHCCVDIQGWKLTRADADKFVSRGVLRDMPDEDIVQAIPTITGNRRRVREFAFSRGGIVSCDIYDKTLEVNRSGKKWMYEVWKSNGWDEESIVIRVEFRVKRDWLRDRSIEDPYDLLEKIGGIWQTLSQEWLRHTIPLGKNQSRWESSEVWQVVQGAVFYDAEVVPIVRQKKYDLDAYRSLANTVGHMAGWAARAGVPLSEIEGDGSGIYVAMYDQMMTYLQTHKFMLFPDLVEAKATKIGIPVVQ
jgi:hypothetical protein